MDEEHIAAKGQDDDRLRRQIAADGVRLQMAVMMLGTPFLTGSYRFMEDAERAVERLITNKRTLGESVDIEIEVQAELTSIKHSDDYRQMQSGGCVAVALALIVISSLVLFPH